MNSPRSKLRGITSASLRYADNKEFFLFVTHPTLQGAGNSKLNKMLFRFIESVKKQHETNIFGKD